jgi:hypothetical protein
MPRGLQAEHEQLKVSNDFRSGSFRRHCPGIELDAILSRHRGEVVAVEIVDQTFRRGQLAPLGPVGVKDKLL